MQPLSFSKLKTQTRRIHRLFSFVSEAIHPSTHETQFPPTGVRPRLCWLQHPKTPDGRGIAGKGRAWPHDMSCMRWWKEGKCDAMLHRTECCLDALHLSRINTTHSRPRTRTGRMVFVSFLCHGFPPEALLILQDVCQQRRLARAEKAWGVLRQFGLVREGRHAIGNRFT
jgi:hypothetical protein